MGDVKVTDAKTPIVTDNTILVQNDYNGTPVPNGQLKSGVYYSWLNKWNNMFDKFRPSVAAMIEALSPFKTVANTTTIDLTLSTAGQLTADLNNTSVTAGTYTNTNLTVDAQGRITAASNGSGGSGTVTNVSALTIGTTGTDLSSTVANPTTTPVITLNVPTASATNRGALSSTDWSTFNSKEPAITWAQGDILYGTGTNTYAKLAKSTTAGQFLSNSGTSNSPAWATPIGIAVPFGSMLGSLSPADATTYYFGGQYATNATTTATVRRIWFGVNCTITNVYGQFFNSASASGETSSLYIRVNNTTDYLVSSSIVNNSQTTTFSGTGLSISMTAGGYIEFKWITPTWGTNPTNISMWGTLYAE